MTLYQFNALPHQQQLTYLFQEGTYLARRYEAANSVSLYHLPSHFFVELYFDPRAKKLVRLRSFTSAAPLEDYAVLVQLPNEWT